MGSPKILTLDIESSPLESWTWGIWDQNVGLEQIKTEWTILSYAAKWLGKRPIIYQDTGGRGKGRVRDDKPLMGLLWKLLDEADIVVAQNGKRFDVRKINARLIMHGYGPPSPYRVIDTMLAAKKYFAFTSQKLAWTSKYLAEEQKDEHKKFPGFKLWVACLEDNPVAWKEMKKYNKQDVRSTEEVYLKLRPWINDHPNLGVFNLSESPVCPKCGSYNLLHGGSPRYSVKQQGMYPRYQCKDCGGYCRGKITTLPLEKRRSLMVPE